MEAINASLFVSRLQQLFAEGKLTLPACSLVRHRRVRTYNLWINIY